MSDNPMTKVNGVHVVYGLIGETVSNSEMIATDKKYKFATRRNCSYNPFGKKDTRLYLPVLMELFLNFGSAVSFGVPTPSTNSLFVGFDFFLNLLDRLDDFRTIFSPGAARSAASIASVAIVSPPESESAFAFRARFVGDSPSFRRLRLNQRSAVARW